jgi:UDP-N-acetylglucosamine transferase subunit ALG13
MIFVTVGSADPFDRLVGAAAALAQIDSEVVVQRGRSDVAGAGATYYDFLPYARVAELVGSSRAVVCHAGVGSVLTCLLQGRRPVVVPRLKRLGEAVDDHQVAFAARLAADGLVTLVRDVEELVQTVQGTSAVVDRVELGDALADDLRGYIVSRTARRRLRQAS